MSKIIVASQKSGWRYGTQQRSRVSETGRSETGDTHGPKPGQIGDTHVSSKSAKSGTPTCLCRGTGEIGDTHVSLSTARSN